MDDETAEEAPPEPARLHIQWIPLRRPIPIDPWAPVDEPEKDANDA